MRILQGGVEDVVNAALRKVVVVLLGSAQGLTSAFFAFVALLTLLVGQSGFGGPARGVTNEVVVVTLSVVIALLPMLNLTTQSARLRQRVGLLVTFTRVLAARVDLGCIWNATAQR
jgi:hypothetical protein